jgi:lipoate-protein ligase A
VRRSSGGGSVEHHGDSTFSLIVPAIEPIGKIAPALLYERLHHALVQVLGEFGFQARLIAAHEIRRGEACFQAPSLNDIVIENQKIVGGAQRRCGGKLLYQGSLNLLGQKKLENGEIKVGSVELYSQIVKPLFFSLAAHLSIRVELLAEQASWIAEAYKLAAKRYRSIAWTHRK